MIMVSNYLVFQFSCQFKVFIEHDLSSPTLGHLMKDVGYCLPFSFAKKKRGL